MLFYFSLQKRPSRWEPKDLHESVLFKKEIWVLGQGKYTNPTFKKLDFSFHLRREWTKAQNTEHSAIPPPP